MNLFILNVAFAAVFTALMGNSRISDFLLGFAIGYATLWLTKPLYQKTRYFQKFPKALNLTFYFLKELAVSNLRVLWDVITPKQINRPGIIGVPLDARSDLEIFLVANLLSLTPGTLSVDLSDDRRTLFVHVMFLDSAEASRTAIKKELERRVLEVTRS